MGEAVPGDVGWVVVIPAKSLATAKSRLGDVAGTRRRELALAMLLDTVEAATATHGVRRFWSLPTTTTIRTAATALGAVVVPDAPRAGLNAAFDYGIAAAASLHPGGGVALLTGDLPALRPAELGSVLQGAVLQFASAPVAVADRGGDGTTLLAARDPASLRPSFGAGSFARHRALGAAAIEESIEGLRCDVDDNLGLRAALAIGVGRATAALLAPVDARGPGS